MKLKSVKMKLILVSVLSLFIVACGSGSGEKDTDLKYLNVTYAPINEYSSLVPIEKYVLLNFTDILNEDTINNLTIYLLDENNNHTPVELNVSEKTVSITPDEYFIADHFYTIVVTTEVEDIQGRSLFEMFTYTYRTVSNDVADTDGDGIIDGADVDIDGDGINDNGTDTDGDGIRDNADADVDGDGIVDNGSDTDGDGINNATDIDDDNDATPDVSDAFPLDPTEAVDTDGDGIGDNADADVDGDGIVDNGPDTDEDGLNDHSETTVYGTDPNDADTDDDGINDGDEVALGTNPNLDEEDASIAPSINDQVFTYDENQLENTIIATVSASDNVAVTDYLFTETDTNTSIDEYFVIDKHGNIMITAIGVLSEMNDFQEGVNSKDYNITVYDGAGNNATAMITLNVNGSTKVDPSLIVQTGINLKIEFPKAIDTSIAPQTGDYIVDGIVIDAADIQYTGTTVNIKLPSNEPALQVTIAGIKYIDGTYHNDGVPFTYDIPQN